MSFGFSIGDFVLLAQLAKNTVQNARRACGAREELVREVESLHIVLRRVKAEVSKPASIINRTDDNGTDDNRRAELNSLAKHCRDVLRVLSAILDKYNELSEQEKSVTKLWKQVKFGNGEMKDLANIRSELATHTQAFSMFLNLLSIGLQGKVEQYMDSQGRDLREIKKSLNWVTASLQVSSRGENSKSILTTYTDDDKETWKNFRRELIKEGFSHQTLKRHKRTIREYLMELGERGCLDDAVLTDHEDDDSSGTSSSKDDEAPSVPRGKPVPSIRSATTSFRNSTSSNKKEQDILQHETPQAQFSNLTQSVGFSLDPPSPFQARLVDLSSMEAPHYIPSQQVTTNTYSNNTPPAQYYRLSATQVPLGSPSGGPYGFSPPRTEPSIQHHHSYTSPWDPYGFTQSPTLFPPRYDNKVNNATHAARTTPSGEQNTWFRPPQPADFLVSPPPPPPPPPPSMKLAMPTHTSARSLFATFLKEPNSLAAYLEQMDISSKPAI